MWKRVSENRPPVGQKVRIWHPVLDEIHATMLPSGLWLFQHNGSLVDAPWIDYWMPCSEGPEKPKQDWDSVYNGNAHEWFGPDYTSTYARAE